MKMKKILALALVCFFAMYSVSFAAIGGKRGGFSAPKAPSVSTPKQAPSTSAKPNQGDYKPSKDAKSLDKNAPAATGKTNAQSAAGMQPQGSAFGGMMRSVGLFAGGMFLGSMLGNMFGFGAGMFSDILGMLVNVALLGGVFMLGRMVWNKFRNKDNDKDKGRGNIYSMRR